MLLALLLSMPLFAQDAAALRLGLGAGVTGSADQVAISDGTYYTMLSSGISGSMRLRWPGGFALEPSLAAFNARTTQANSSGGGPDLEISSSGLRGGLIFRPRLGVRGGSELALLTGLEGTWGRLRATDDGTQSGYRALQAEALLGLAIEQWLRPNLSLSADLSAAVGGGEWQHLDQDEDQDEARLSVSFSPSTRLMLHLWY